MRSLFQVHHDLSGLVRSWWLINESKGVSNVVEWILISAVCVIGSPVIVSYRYKYSQSRLRSRVFRFTNSCILALIYLCIVAIGARIASTLWATRETHLVTLLAISFKAVKLMWPARVEIIWSWAFSWNNVWFQTKFLITRSDAIFHLNLRSVRHTWS